MSFADSVTVTNGVTSGTAGSASAQVLTIQGITCAVPVCTTPVIGTASANYFNQIAPATPAIATPKASAGYLYGVIAFNLNATPVYLKFFDNGSPSLGTTNASFQFMIPGNTGGAGFVIALMAPRYFVNAIKFAVTGAIAVNDNTAITANSVIVDVSSS